MYEHYTSFPLCFLYTVMVAGAATIQRAAPEIENFPETLGKGGSITLLSFKTGSGGEGGGRSNLGICFKSFPGGIGLI